MHLIRFEYQDRVRLGALHNGRIVDLSAASNWNLPPDTSALLGGDGGGRAREEPSQGRTPRCPQAGERGREKPRSRGGYRDDHCSRGADRP